MSKLKKITVHLKHMGPVGFMQSVHRWSKKRVKERMARHLWRLGLTPPIKVMHETNWITMTFGIGEVNGKADILNAFTEEERKRIFLEANRACQQKFTLLGSAEQDFSEAIPWHTDFKSGYTWPLDYYLDISTTIGNLQSVQQHADIKIPWELSRMQHLIPLGQAFSLSGERRYYEAFRSQTLDFIDQNPYKLGPNWASTMDVAIRAVNWTGACVYFRTAIELDQSFSTVLLTHLNQTGEFIEQNLECDFSGHGNNHYLANLTGQIFLGLLLGKKLPRALKWLKSGIAGLESEMLHQVNEDGGSFEGSLSYHRLSTEMFLCSAVIMRQNGYEFSETTLMRLEKMCGFIQNYMKPNGTAPVIGDADDGRLLMMGTYYYENKRDHRHLLGTAGFFFNRADFIASAGMELTEMKWFFGNSPFPVQQVELPAFVAYPQTGVYIFRDTALYLIIKCGPVGTNGKGGHDHNDQLSFELHILGSDVVIDSGTFVYTADSEQRQLFRSVSAHNVPQYANLEQNTIRNTTMAHLFRMESAHGGNCLHSGLTDDGMFFEGTMAYEDSGVRLRRQITVNSTKRIISIQDVFEGGLSGASQIERLHVSKDILEVIFIENSVLLRTIGGAEIKLAASAPILSNTCRISESYGVFYEATCLEWSMKQSSSFIINY